MSHEKPEDENQEEQHGQLGVPGPESHEREDALSPDELGTEDEPVPPPVEPKQA